MRRCRPYPCFALLATFGWGCTNTTPPIAQGLPISFGPTSEFPTRLRERFPVGSSEQAVVAELRAEGFTIQPAAHTSTAVYEASRFPCRNVWKVEWAAEAQKITTITGEARAICL